MSESTTFKLHAKLEQDSYRLGQLLLSDLLLINDQQFPWFVLVPRVANIREIYLLEESQQQMLWRESAQLSQVIMQQFSGEKLNIAAIGNLVPQLHLHHVVRFSSDLCWPAPIWGKLPMREYSLQQVQIIQQKIAAKMPDLRQHLI